MADQKIDESQVLKFQFRSPFLYKYCDPSGVDILDSLRLKVTPPNFFNDPFEFTPKSVSNFNHDSIKDLLPFDRKSVLKMWNEMPTEKRLLVDFETLYSALQNERSRGFTVFTPEYKDQVVTRLYDMARNIVMNAPSFLGKQLGVVCLSEVPDDILMWSHYTKKHQGFVLGFDIQDPFIRNAVNLMPVEYSSERAVLDIFVKEANEDLRPYISILRRKSLHWAYEREWRMVCHFKDCVPGKDPQGEDCYYRSIEPTTVSKIIFGKRCDDDTRSNVEQAIAKNHLTHVKRYRADIDESDFRLNIFQIE